MAAEEDPRDVLRSVAYGSDSRISPGDRVRAIERLAELERDSRRAGSIDDLVPDQVLAELESLRDAMPGAIALQRVVMGEDPSHVVEPPEEEDDLREALGLAMQVNELLELRVGQLERVIQNQTIHRRLLAAEPPVA
jgi:hypothetical protein